MRTKSLAVTCPNCRETSLVEFNPMINGSFYHTTGPDGTRATGVSALHTKTKRSLKCPYCSSKFVEEAEWR